MDPILYFASLILTGITAGTASGLFGVGGGFLMTPVQYWLYTSGGIDSTLATRLAFGTSLAVMIPTMISGAFAHHRRGAVNWQAAIPMGCAAVFGGLAGGYSRRPPPGLCAPDVLCPSYHHDGSPHGLAYPGLFDLRTPGIGRYLPRHRVSDRHRLRPCRDWRGCPARASPRDTPRLSHAHRGRHLIGLPDLLVGRGCDCVCYQRVGRGRPAALHDWLRESRDLCNPCCNHHPTRSLRRAVRSRLLRQEFADRVCRDADPDWGDDARERVKKELLVFRWLHLFGKTTFEVLLDIFVIFSEPLVHHRVHLFLGFLKVAPGYRSRIFTQRQHARFPAN